MSAPAAEMLINVAGFPGRTTHGRDPVRLHPGKTLPTAPVAATVVTYNGFHWRLRASNLSTRVLPVWP